MTPEIIGGIVRALLGGIGGALVTAGYLDEVTSQQVSGALTVLAVTAWSIAAKRGK